LKKSTVLIPPEANSPRRFRPQGLCLTGRNCIFGEGFKTVSIKQEKK